MKKDNASVDALMSKGVYYFDRSSLDSSTYFYRRAATLSLSNNNFPKYVVCLYEIGHNYRIQGELSKARSVTTEAFSAYSKHKLSDSLILADLYHLSGTLFLQESKYDESVRELNQAVLLRLKKNGDRDTMLSRTYNNLGTCFYYRGEYDKAMFYYKKALKISSYRKNKFSAEVGDYHQTIGIIYSMKGEFEMASEHFLSALEVNEKNLGEGDPKLAYIYNNLGLFNFQIGKQKLALNYFTRAEKILRAQKNVPALLGQIYMNTGNIFSSENDFEKALSYYLEAETIFSETLPQGHPVHASVSMNIGYIYYQMNQTSRALEYYLKSRNIPADPTTVVKTLRNLAGAYAKAGQYELADRSFLEAVQAGENLLGPAHFEVAGTCISYGRFKLNRKDYEGARTWLKKGNVIFLSIYGERHPEVAGSFTVLGILAYETAQYSKALRHFQKAIISSTEAFSDTSFNALPEAVELPAEPYIFDLLYFRSLSFQKLYELSDYKKLEYLQQAYRTAGLAIRLTENIRSRYSAETSRLFLSEKNASFFSLAVHLCAELYAADAASGFGAEAFLNAEKSKSAVLLSLVSDASARDLGKVHPFILNLEKDISSSILSYQKLIYEEKLKPYPDSSKLTLWNRKLFEFNRQYERLTRFMEFEYPEYYELKFQSPTLSLEQVQQKIGSESALIEYAVHEKIMYIFLVTSDKFEIQKTEADSTLFEAMEIYRTHLLNEDLNPSPEDFRNYISAAYLLYEKLLGPVAGSLGNRDIIVVADGSMGYLPFESFLTTTVDGKKMEYRKLPYLIRQRAVSYANSASLLYSEPRQGKKSKHNVLAFAPDYLNRPLDDNLYSREEIELAEKLMPLSGTDEEIRMVESHFDTKVFTDKMATERNFKKTAGDYDVLHMAMHAVINDDNPFYSSLVFSLNGDTAGNEGFLNTHEIYGLKLNARLTVLSACNTGAGKLQRGEGVMNLARGFIYAGCPSVVMTLWPVNDESGAELMASFYKYLSEGQKLDRALRDAKLDYLSKADQVRAHPYFWSSYVVIGDTSPLTREGNMGVGITVVVICLILCAAVVWFYYHYRRKKKLSRLLSSD